MRNGLLAYAFLLSRSSMQTLNLRRICWLHLSAGTLVLLTCGTVLAEDADSPKARKLIENFLRRRDAITSGHFVIRRTRKEGQQLSPPTTQRPLTGRGASREDDIELQIWVDGKRIRTDQCFAAKGDARLVLSTTVLDTLTLRCQAGGIAYLEGGTSAKNVMVDPRTVGYKRRFDSGEALRNYLAPPNARFAIVGTEILDGHSTTIVQTIFPERPQVVCKTWIAPEQDFALVKQEWTNGDHQQTGKIELQQVANGMWYPRKAVWRGTRKGEVVEEDTITVVQAEINIPIPRETFSFEAMGVPPGRKIIANTSGIVIGWVGGKPPSCKAVRSDGKTTRQAPTTSEPGALQDY